MKRVTQDKDNALLENIKLVGQRAFYDDLIEGKQLVVHRSRRSRRAQARQDRLDWRELSEKEKLIQ